MNRPATAGTDEPPALSLYAQLEAAAAERAAAIRRDDWPGASCVNASFFDGLRSLRNAGLHVAAELREARAWRTWSSQEANIRVAGWSILSGEPPPAFSLPVPRATSLDTRQQNRRQVRRRLDPGVKARQRDRYKGAAADSLETFARLHLRRDPRAGLYRPRWLDHRAGCKRGRCMGCAGIPTGTAPRWRRRGRRGRDYLLGRTIPVPEWLLDRAAGLRSCREAIALRDATCGGTLIVPQSCRTRTCPDCESSRQTRVVAAYQAAVAALEPDRVRFLTVTQRNVPRSELAGGMDTLSANLSKLKRRAIWRGGRCRERSRCRQPADPARPGWRLPHRAVTASMTTLEITYNAERRSWHPHAHLLLESDYIDQAELADTWEAITGDSRVVWIESVRRHAEQRWSGDVQAALRELLKYAAKPSPAFLSTDRDAAVLAELLVALRGRHLTSTAGKLHGLDLEADEPERDLVLVQPDDPRAEPVRAPRVCPLCGEVAAWSVVGWARRRDARPAPARAGPFLRVLALPQS